MSAVVLSGFVARVLLSAVSRGESSVVVSVDLGVRRAVADLTDGGVAVEGSWLSREDLMRMSEKGERCFLLEGDGVFELRTFSEQTNKSYALYAPGPALPPTVSISGVRMHQTRNVDPIADARSKAATLAPVDGSVLDTCFGLGYSAVALRRAGAERVQSFEVDAAVYELACVNPWSRSVFDDDAITVTLDDISSAISTLPTDSFSCVLHDPPRLALAGNLYGASFYGELFRVLQNGGRLFHYVGSPGARFRNKKVVEGVMARLKESGFISVQPHTSVQGVTAEKPH